MSQKDFSIYDDLFLVKGKNIILTGSSGILGSLYSQILLERGANLALLDIKIEKSKLIQKEFSKKNNQIFLFKCDLSKPRNIINTFKLIFKKFKTIDVLINNAAFVSSKTFHLKDFKNYETHPFNLWKKSFEVNIDAYHVCTQQVLGCMKKQKRGNIINVASTYGIVGPDFGIYENEKLWTSPGYAVTKSAVLNFTRYIANLYGKYNIRCNTLSPGGIATSNHSNSFIRKYSSRTALNRMAKPEDYAGPIVFLCSDASRYMTGANLIIDGGWTAR